MECELAGDSDRELMREWQQKFLRAKDQRTVLETYCQNITQYFAPWLGRYPGDDMKPDQLHGKRMDKILDSAIYEALEIAQNGMHSGLTPSSRPWFRLEYRDKELNKFGKSRDWLSKLADTVYAVLRGANFYPSIHASYAEVLLFATAGIARSRYPDSGLVYKDMTFGEYWISSSVGYKIDTAFRSRWMTAKQIVEQFGKDHVSRQVMGDYEKTPFNSYEIIHCVQPRPNYKSGKQDAKSMPFESVWWENMSSAELAAQQSSQTSSTPHLLRESGFKNFPYYFPRWHIVGSNHYGTGSPGMKQEGEARYLQELKKSMIIAVHKELDPPMVADTSQKGMPIRRNAGGTTYADMSIQNAGQLKPLYQVKFNVPAGQALMNESRMAIKNGFFNNLFLMLMNIENQPDRLTARQVDEMKAQGLLQLGPFIEHMTEDVLNTIVLGAIDEILEFPEWYNLEPPPPEVQNQHYDIIYISILAQAQREIGKSAIDEMMAFIGANAQMFPDILDIIDPDTAGRTRADLINVPSNMIRSEDIVEAIRKKRAEELKKKEMMEQVQAAANTAQTLGKTPTAPDDPNALTTLFSTLNQGGAP